MVSGCRCKPLRPTGRGKGGISGRCARSIRRWKSFGDLVVTRVIRMAPAARGAPKGAGKRDLRGGEQKPHTEGGRANDRETPRPAASPEDPAPVQGRPRSLTWGVLGSPLKGGRRVGRRDGASSRQRPEQRRDGSRPDHRKAMGQ